MKPLAIELVQGQKQQLQSIGWKTPKEGDCRRQFYALDQTGKALVITPKVALPGFYVPGASVVFSCEQFPEAVCVEISPCRLLAPPCYQSHEDVERQRYADIHIDRWRAIYSKTHDQVLILEPADEGRLQKRLAKWQSAMRAAYKWESGVWRKEIKRLKGGTLKDLKLASETERAKRLKEAQSQLDIVESKNPIDGVPCKGRLKLTLQDVKRGHEGIRDAWIHEVWARKNGENLVTMTWERRVFRSWLETHTGTHANIFDANTRQKRRAISPPNFGDKYENNPQFREACAKVRYRARFADKAGSVVYLEDCETREELTTDERDEVAKLTGTTDRRTAKKSEAPAPVHQTSTPDAQFEFVNPEGTEWRKAGPQMVRRGDLAELQRTTKDASAFRSLLELHPERWFYPVKQITAVREATKTGKRRPIAAKYDITDWDEKWRPPGAPKWSHPGKKSGSIGVNPS